MRRALVVLGALASAACGSATPLARAPAARPAIKAAIAGEDPSADLPPIVEGDVTAGSAAGVTVIVKRVPGAAFAAGKLFVRGGARNWTRADAGLERLAFETAATGGTAAHDEAAMARELSALGARLWSETGNDFSGLYVKAPAAAWDGAFALLAESFRTPALPANAFERARERALAELRWEEEDPDAALLALERSQLYAGHPYANRPAGTPASLLSLSAQDLAPYLAKLRAKSRLLFVAVGDLEARRVFEQVARAFGDLPAGDYVERPMPPLAFERSRLATRERTIPTNYCALAFRAASWREPDHVAGLVATSVLSHRLEDEVRTRRGLAYAVYAMVNDATAAPFGLMYVTAADPTAAAAVVLEQVDRLRSYPVDGEDLAAIESTFVTEYLARNETVDAQAWELAEAQLHGGDWRLARDLPARVRAITPAEVQAFAATHFVRLQAAVLGDPKSADRARFTSR